MKHLKLCAVVMTFLLTSQRLVCAQEMDKELSELANKLASLIKDNGKKKVTVLDFTDLQGIDSELGKYIAEELTVDLVMVKKDFSVLDRANLKKILAEHNLTATGLVDPENAKKLGQFAGVDALILGSIIPKNQNVSLTAKIITTDTAEIVGAAKAEFKSDETVQKLFSRAASTETSTPGKPQSKMISQDFGNCRVVMSRLRGSANGQIDVDLTFQNKNTQRTIAVAMYHDPCWVEPCYMRCSLIAGDGTHFDCHSDDLSGIRSMRFGPQALTEIEPAGEIKTSVRFPGRSLSSTVSSFTFQAEIIVNQDYKSTAYDNYRMQDNVMPPGCKLHNLVFEIPVKRDSQTK